MVATLSALGVVAGAVPGCCGGVVSVFEPLAAGGVWGSAGCCSVAVGGAGRTGFGGGEVCCEADGAEGRVAGAASWVSAAVANTIEAPAKNRMTLAFMEFHNYSGKPLQVLNDGPQASDIGHEEAS